jgi:hypothetical protein
MIQRVEEFIKPVSRPRENESPQKNVAFGVLFAICEPRLSWQLFAGAACTGKNVRFLRCVGLFDELKGVSDGLNFGQ